ncbi:MAG TPA: hypothetical protein V6C63_16850 [Allocoleopsis sp.]
MTEQELHSSIDGLFAYDTGSLDSGIHDKQLKAEVVRRLSDMSQDELRLFLGRHAREYYLTEEKLAQGYGLEDALEFHDWVKENLLD